VLLGDPSQQGSIGRGAIARWLIRQCGDAVVELRVAHRFHDPVQAEVLGKMHDGSLSWARIASTTRRSASTGPACPGARRAAPCSAAS
jgi:hypothetical protein